MFAERYRQALAFKSLDVEEYVDRYFHRPIAAVIAAVLIPLPVTPNQVTLAGLATGWIGVFFLYWGFFVGQLGPSWAWAVAAGFLFLSMLLDCADGQLARATGGGSRVGRILDGFVDVLVLLPTYVVLGMGVYAEYGIGWLTITAVAGFSTWAHCIVYDKLKNLYLARTKPEADGADGAESIEDVQCDYDDACNGGSVLERFLLYVYLGYLQVQQRLASGSTKKKTEALTKQQIRQFRRQNRSTMRMAAVLGLGSHMLVIYTGLFAMIFVFEAVLVMQIVFATVFNVWMFFVLWRARRFTEPVGSVAQ